MRLACTSSFAYFALWKCFYPTKLLTYIQVKAPVQAHFVFRQQLESGPTIIVAKNLNFKLSTWSYQLEGMHEHRDCVQPDIASWEKAAARSTSTDKLTRTEKPHTYTLKQLEK